MFKRIWDGVRIRQVFLYVLVDGKHFSIRPHFGLLKHRNLLYHKQNRTFAHGKLTQVYICCNVCINLSCVCCNIKFTAAIFPISAATILPTTVAAIDPKSGIWDGVRIRQVFLYVLFNGRHFSARSSPTPLRLAQTLKSIISRAQNIYLSEHILAQVICT